jgi:preprotein translocase subunit SecG
VETVVRILHWIVTIGLIVAVVLQPGRSAGLSLMGGGFEGMSSRKKKGLEALFSKLTVGFAVAFMVTSLALAFLRR